MKRVLIARPLSHISWWNDLIGQVVPVLEVYEKTGYVKIEALRTEEGFEPYKIQGWINPECLDVVE
ncbi:hypothetical protein PQE66_gp128 [Bacillus phage PBC2]|uniref:Uncharacterized protein n=1 Tax=Bacillus phage PBC2 TaxID=1675029 RepID=A0A218KC26_9CAUD|nr:hypothetical protein PQE66_gp128 [Bacillus phage PBC2]AKQ08443.1 hypothetical protein PBC2_128 [Bacillus phage PBC2]